MSLGAAGGGSLIKNIPTGLISIGKPGANQQMGAGAQAKQTIVIAAQRPSTQVTGGSTKIITAMPRQPTPMQGTSGHQFIVVASRPNVVTQQNPAMSTIISELKLMITI